MLLDVIKILESYEQISKAEHLEAEAEFERVREEFKKEPAKLEQQIENTTKALDNAFDFMEEAFGQSQEMVVFVTELNVNYYSVWFIKEMDVISTTSIIEGFCLMNSKRRSWQRWMNWRENFNIKRSITVIHSSKFR